VCHAPSSCIFCVDILTPLGLRGFLDPFEAGSPALLSLRGQSFILLFAHWTVGRCMSTLIANVGLSGLTQYLYSMTREGHR
jgi:hypothetical protein